jgi:hypothetical protein
MESSSWRRAVLEIRIEEIIPKALGYDEVKLLASARGEERKRLIKLLLGGVDG